MKKMFKALASVFMMVAILASCMPFAFAEEIGGSCGENLQWTFNEATGELVISGTGEMDDYEGVDLGFPNEDFGPEPDPNDEEALINYADKMVENIVVRDYDLPWGEYLSQIKKITVNEGVTSISDLAFVMCSNLIEVNLPDSLRKIGCGAFNYCINLKEIYIPDGMVGIEDHAFAICVRLEKINIPRSIEVLGEGVFESCVSLKSIELPKINGKLHAADFGYELIGIKDIYFEGSEEEFAEIFSQMDISDDGYSTVEEAFKDGYGITIHYNSKMSENNRDTGNENDNQSESEKTTAENKENAEKSNDNNSTLIIILLAVVIVLLVVLIAVIIIVSTKKKKREEYK